MIDSYLAPTDLAAARRRVLAVVETRCRRSGFAPGPSGGWADDAVLTLDPGPVGPQLARISPTTTAVVAELVLWRWAPDAVGDLAKRMEPGTALVFLEPTADLGWRRLVHRLGRVALRVRYGHDFEADVPAALRAAGLVVTTTDRFGLGPMGIRSYVWGVAEHFP